MGRIAIVRSPDKTYSADVIDRQLRQAGIIQQSGWNPTGTANKRISLTSSWSVVIGAINAWTDTGIARWTGDNLFGWSSNSVQGAGAGRILVRIRGVTSSFTFFLQWKYGVANEQLTTDLLLPIPIYLPDVGLTAGESKTVEYFNDAAAASMHGEVFVG